MKLGSISRNTVMRPSHHQPEKETPCHGRATSSGGHAAISLLRGVSKKRFLPIDTYPQIVAFVETLPGKILLLIVFASLLAPLTRLWLPVTVAAGVCAYSGSYRNVAVTLGTLGILFVYYCHRPNGQFISPYWIDWSTPFQIGIHEGLQPHLVFRLNWMILVFVFLASSLAITFIRRFPDYRVSKRPVLFLHGTYFVLVLVAVSGMLRGIQLVSLWSLIVTLGAYFWFLCYALADQRLKDGSPAYVQLGLFHPFWGSSSTPVGKGAGYLRKVEAKSPKDLAVTQLKALKLLLWVWVLRLLMHFLRGMAIGILEVPTLDQVLARHASANAYPWHVCWLALLYRFVYGMLYIAFLGDKWVACGRLAGYRMLRNSCRPLSSTNLADFWNRYYYYFKELLVNVFFFPTFFRYFKNNTRLRILFAIFMAAGVGNLVFHFMREIGSVAEVGLLRAVTGFRSYAFYCMLLSMGIGLSQMRRRRKDPEIGWIRGQLLPSLGVVVFYCILEVFNVDTYSQEPLTHRFGLLLYLFGLGT
jgi:hypothetical protein